jgi:hypothetical protein
LSIAAIAASVASVAVAPVAAIAAIAAVAWTIADAPPVKVKRQEAKKLPVREWSVGDEIRFQERSCGLPNGAIAALIEHETGGTWDERSYNPEKSSKCYQRAKTQKEKDRCGSRGLTQVVAKWHLPPGVSASLLDDPIVAVRLGARKLCREYKRAGGDLRLGYERYNGVGKDAVRYSRIVMNEFKYFKRMS